MAKRNSKGQFEADNSDDDPSHVKTIPFIAENNGKVVLNLPSFKLISILLLLLVIFYPWITIFFSSDLIGKSKTLMNKMIGPETCNAAVNTDFRMGFDNSEIGSRPRSRNGNLDMDAGVLSQEINDDQRRYSEILNNQQRQQNQIQRQQNQIQQIQRHQQMQRHQRHQRQQRNQPNQPNQQNQQNQQNQPNQQNQQNPLNPLNPQIQQEIANVEAAPIIVQEDEWGDININ